MYGRSIPGPAGRRAPRATKTPDAIVRGLIFDEPAAGTYFCSTVTLMILAVKALLSGL